jgi:hypothetical protein
MIDKSAIELIDISLCQELYLRLRILEKVCCCVMVILVLENGITCVLDKGAVNDY